MTKHIKTTVLSSQFLITDQYFQFVTSYTILMITLKKEIECLTKKKYLQENSTFNIYIMLEVRHFVNNNLES